jgi:hypothetical protein
MLQDISALTPPVLMCAVVLLAIGAFLRHEMNRKRPEDVDESPDIPAEQPISAQSQLANNEASPRSSASEDDDA